MKAAVLGATGYTGALLLRILSHHPEISAIVPVSRSQAGRRVWEHDPGLSFDIADKLVETDGEFVGYDEAESAGPEVVFSALPHLASAEHCAPFVGKAAVIDLSADFRHRDEQLFRRAYDHERPAPDLQHSAVYGLSEWGTAQLESAAIIGNPGCYPTATLLPLLPLLRDGIIVGDIVVNAISGISGAGKKERTDLLFCERTENVNAYSPGRQHRHSFEIIEQLQSAGAVQRFLFTPHLVPIDQGMAVTSAVALRGGATEADVADCLATAYAERPFVVLAGNRVPETKHVRGTNRCDVGWHVEDGSVILFSVLDNLWKGAAGQAVQNMNIRFGMHEAVGLCRHGEV